jgi:hypothetical protein
MGFSSLVFRCESCKEVVPLGYNAYSRMDLENELGTYFSVQCRKCLARKKYHVNDVIAKSSDINFMLIVGLFTLFFIICTLLLYMVGFISLLTIIIPFGAYMVVRKNQQKSINMFNKSQVSRENNYIPKNKINL